MSAADVVACVRGIGLPIVRMAWAVGKAPQLPWCVFYLDEEQGFDADDARWAARSKWVVELYQKYPDHELEDRLGGAIEDAFGPFRKYESWADTESCSVTAFHFSDIQSEE